MTKRKEIQNIAKTLVNSCFRNTFLEDLHAGKGCGGKGEGFSNKDMKKLMIEAVDKTYTFLLQMNGEEIMSPKGISFINMMENSTKEWNKPKLSKDFTTK